MLKRHQIRVSSTIFLAVVVSAVSAVANLAIAAPTSRQVPAKPAAKASPQHSRTQTAKGANAVSSKDATSSSGSDDDESHLHGFIPSGKHSEENMAEPLSMDGDDPMFEDSEYAPVVLQEQKAKMAFPKGVLQPGDRSDALPHYNLANKYLNQGRFQDAARKYRDAITIYDKDADFYVNLGVALRKLNDFAGAEQAFKQALTLNSTDWMAWSNLANAYLKQERLVETVESFRQCLKCKPPVQERAAIEQDIKDITKILRMRDPNFDANAGASAAASKTAKTDKQAKSMQTTKSTKTAQAATSEGRPQPASAITPVSPDKLKGTGWDYMYK